MKKMLFGIIATVLITSLSFGQTISNEDVYKHLQSKYDFEKIDFNVNESKNDNLLNSLKNDKFISASVSLNELDLSNVSVIYHKDGVKSLLIPFVENSNHNLVVSIIGNNYDNLLQTVIVKNDIDTKGNGFINLSTPSETFSDKFIDGKKEATSAKKSCFRNCFDQAYDDICDGFIGCASWYSSPFPALTAIGYCGIKCA